MSSKKPLPSPATTTTTTTTTTTKKKPELEVDEDEEQKDLNYMKLKNSETATSFITMAANKSYLSSASLSTLGNLNTINNTVNNVNNSEDEEATAQEDGEVEEEELIDNNNNNNANKQKKKAAKKSTKKQPTKRRFLFKLPNKKSQLAGTKKSKKKPDDYAVTKSVKKRGGKRTAPSTTTSTGTTKNSGEQLVNKSRTSTTSGENNILVSIKSNVWGTKFKFYGHKYLPELIGQIVYKTSLFHLQPRQMTITLEDLTYPTATVAATNTVKPKEVVMPPKVSSNKPSTTKPAKTMKKVDSDNVSLLSKSIDVLSEYSASAGILAPASNGLKRRDSTYSSISSLIDPLATNSANKARRELQKEVSMDETCSTARDLMLNKLTTIEIVDKQPQKPQLPVLTLAGENSIEVYYENCSMVDSPDDRQKLIISNTVGNDSVDDTNRYFIKILYL